MAKQTGLGWTTLSIDDSGGTPVACVNDITDFSVSTPMAVQETTGLDKFAIERLLLHADASGTFNGVFNSATSHTVFSTVPTTRVSRTVTSVISAKTLAFEGLLTDYPLKRSNTGELTFAVPVVLADGNAPTWS